MDYIKIKDVEIPVRLNSNRNCKNLRVIFNINKGYMNISKPKFLSISFVKRYINSNENLIYDEYLKMLDIKRDLEKQEYNLSRKWVTGEKLLYQGKELDVIVNEIEDNKIEIKLEKDNFVINIKSGLDEKTRKDNIVKAVKNFFKTNTEAIIYEKLNYWSKYTGIEYNSFRVKQVKTRWGSCVKATKSLNFSSRLIMFPSNVVDSVVVHELCHIKEANHGEKFWNLVYNFIPGYKECNNWIKQNSKKLEFE